MKNILFILMLALGSTFVACSDSNDDGGYDPNTAETPYKPLPGRKVASLKTTNTIDGRDYWWEHKFTYDASGRIMEIKSEMQHYEARAGDYVLCKIYSDAFYYYRGNELEVAYSLKRTYPNDLSIKNSTDSGTDRGLFNSAGVLVRFHSADFEYSGTSLRGAYFDGGVKYNVARDNSGNVTGYVRENENNGEKDDCSGKYGYSRIRNKSNFDFSGYFGYWGVETGIYANRLPYYASYQLAAFGMLGAISSYLPLSVKDENGNEYGTWELDSRDCPVLYTAPDGRRTEITYID